MSFEHASVTKGYMLSLAFISIAAGLFDVKHYMHLQLVPHVSKYHQYWRLFSHHIACANSSDLFLTELLLYNVGVHIERAFGSVKFASFLILSTLVNTISTFITLLILSIIPSMGGFFDRIPSGPIALVFCIVYQYLRLVPQAYRFRVFGLTLSDKIWVYVVALQLAISHSPASWLPACLGLLTGYIYRSDLLQLKGWRVPHRLVTFSQRWAQPIFVEAQTIRRSNRVFPEVRNRGNAQQGRVDGSQNEEIVTTARLPRTQTSPAPSTASSAADTTNAGAETDAPRNNGVVRQWMSELAGAARPTANGEGTLRAPSTAELQMLTGMFPDVAQDVILGVLQRSPSIEAAVETLLSSQS